MKMVIHRYYYQKKKKNKDLKIIGKKRKRNKKVSKEKETKKIIQNNYLSSPLTKSSSGGMSGTMSDMFEKHLPLRKRGRAGSNSGADSKSRKSTPVRPQKGEGAAMLLGMAAFLAGQAQDDDGEKNGGVVVEGKEGGGGSGGSLPQTTSGAKMLADAEFLVSLTGGGAGSPSGTRTLVQRDI